MTATKKCLKQKEVLQSIRESGLRRHPRQWDRVAGWVFRQSRQEFLDPWQSALAVVLGVQRVARFVAGAEQVPVRRMPYITPWELRGES